MKNTRLTNGLGTPHLLFFVYAGYFLMACTGLVVHYVESTLGTWSSKTREEKKKKKKEKKMSRNPLSLSLFQKHDTLLWGSQDDDSNHLS